MSHYATEIKKATCYINSGDFAELRDRIKLVVGLNRWSSYGWRDAVRNAETLTDILSEFNIELERVYGNYYKPVINGAYVTEFFKLALVDMAARYMTNGKIVVDDEYKIITITFNDGKARISYRGRG